MSAVKPALSLLLFFGSIYNGQTCLIDFLLILVVAKKFTWQFEFQIQVISPSINFRNQQVTLEKKLHIPF